MMGSEVSDHWRNLKRQNDFVTRLQAAEQHWFFVQAMQCMDQQLYVPAASSLLNGIEATLRIYVHRYSGSNADWTTEPSAYRVLSNTLICQAKAIGIAVDRLAFPDESDFDEKLRSVKPNRIDVRLVFLRNNICHGNLWPFFEDTTGEGDIIFVPELLKSTTEQLLDVSEAWAAELDRFREERALQQ